jgi:membrane protease YdiL (CAAX protease family)
MTRLPGETPFEPEGFIPSEETATPEPLQSAISPAEILPPEEAQVHLEPQDAPLGDEPQLFESWSRPEIILPERIPHLGHLGLLGAMAVVGLLCASLLVRVALYFHLFGVATLDQAITDIHYTLGSQAVFYLVTFVASLLIFPLIWHKGFFAGLQWNGITALRLHTQLLSAAAICFVLAIVNGILLPGPSDTPIDKIFRAPGAAWMLFAFGVTFAPFFEEIVFRGFLLPALCTACDWIAERKTGTSPRPLGPNGHPCWSILAMVVASIVTSLIFSLMHAQQTSHAVGPLLLLICVSAVLCWVRLSTRSLAASVLVHAAYNFMLFTLMLVGTGGFRHLENM